MGKNRSEIITMLEAEYVEYLNDLSDEDLNSIKEGNVFTKSGLRPACYLKDGKCDFAL